MTVTRSRTLVVAEKNGPTETITVTEKGTENFADLVVISAVTKPSRRQSLALEQNKENTE